MINKRFLHHYKKLSAYCLLIAFSLFLLSGCSTKNTTTEVWGRAEAREIDINSKIPGRVISLLVKEGDKVEKGQILARIDNRDIHAQANQARANIKALESQSTQAATVTELQIKTTQAALDSAKAQLEKARSDLLLSENDYKRFSDLLASNAVSQQLFENYRTKYQVAQANFAQAKASVSAAEAGLLQTQVNQANEASMHSRVAQAEASLQQVEIFLDESEIRAPFGGIVTTKYVEEGSMVSQGMPLVAIQDPTDNWVNVKVKETELSKYKAQQQVTLQGRDDKLRLPGIILDISKKPEFATYRATSERGDTDIITFNVKIQTNSDKVRPGMRFKLLDGGN